MTAPYTRTAASLRHLCSLGLPGEVLVPQFMRTLEEAIPADSHHFNWFDEEMRVVNSYSNLPGIKKYVSMFADLVASQPIGTPRWEQSKRAMRCGLPDELNQQIIDFTFHEVMRPLGAHNAIAHFAFDATRPLGVVNLWRDRTSKFSARESEFLRSVGAYLGYALRAPPATDDLLPNAEGGEEGIALVDRAGNVLQLDETAAHLFELAALPKFDMSVTRAPGGIDQPIRALCQRLIQMTEGQPGRPPQMRHRNAWGEFVLRAHWLKSPLGNGADLVAITIAMLIPRRLQLWRNIHALGLSIRQQEVCLLFAEGLTLPEIAQRINISPHTATDHLRAAYRRLELDQSDRFNLRERLLQPPLAR